MPSSSGIPESSIVFFTGGHDHDGISSGLIKTNQYSIYDWEIGVTVGNGQRGQKQSENAAGFRLLIDSIVKETTLGPAGIRLSPNTITGLHIASNTITANELSANIVLVNNIIRSNNFDGNVAANGSITSVGTAGWAIAGDGTAVLDIAYIRGAIQADSIYINGLNYWNSNGIFSVGEGENIIFYNGTDLELTGKVTATSGQIAGWVIDGDNLETGGNYDGSMIIGQFAETNGGGGVKIEGAADGNSDFGTAILTGDELYFTDTATNDELYVRSTGIEYAITNQIWQFYENGGALFARVNGVDYSLALAAHNHATTAGTTAATTTAAPGGGGGGGGATTTTLATTANPCAGSPAAGTYMGQNCNGCTLQQVYSDGCNGEYVGSSQPDSATCCAPTAQQCYCVQSGSYTSGAGCGGGACFQTWYTYTCTPGGCANPQADTPSGYCSGPAC